METNIKHEILKVLLKDLTINPLITDLAKSMNMSRPGTWKVLKKMESEKLINLSQIGSGKTSTYKINLNWDNPLLEKILALSLTEDSFKSERWRVNFAEVEDCSVFSILFGSILNNSKKANDIDLILVIDKKGDFKNIDKIISKIQKTQLKKIHNISFTKEEFEQEIKKKNKAIINAIKNGLVLFGQENFIKFIKILH